MRQFDVYLKMVGFHDLPETPPQKTVVFAYKNGCVTSFDTILEAKKFSSLFEVVKVDFPERDKIAAARKAAWDRAYDLWFADLKNEYSDVLSDAVFTLCYSEAYAEGHPDGYDEVASCMQSKVEFAVSILKLAGAR